MKKKSTTPAADALLFAGLCACVCLCECVCRPTGRGGGVTGSDAAQRAVDHHDVADVDGIVAEVLLPVAVGVLNTWVVQVRQGQGQEVSRVRRSARKGRGGDGAVPWSPSRMTLAQRCSCSCFKPSIT